MTGFDIAIHVIAERDSLPRDDALLASVEGFRRVAATGPRRIMLCVARLRARAHDDGYDDDPRELWPVPEVARFIRLWAFATGLCEALSPGHPFTVDVRTSP